MGSLNQSECSDVCLRVWLEVCVGLCTGGCVSVQGDCIDGSKGEGGMRAK